MKKEVRIISATFLLWKDWWYLFQKAKLKGVDSIYDYAIRIKLRISQSYIGHFADISSKPYFPHGVTGIFISGGGIYRERLRNISTSNNWIKYTK